MRMIRWMCDVKVCKVQFQAEIRETWSIAYNLGTTAWCGHALRKEDNDWVEK